MIRIFPDLEGLSRAAAELFTARAALAVRTRGRFSVALSGGRTPRRTYELLAQSPRRDNVAWPAVHVFFGDERCVPPDDPQSNARMAREALLERVPIPPEQIHPIAACDEPAQAARRYESTVRAFFGAGPPRFDLVFLGLGEDGHTASLFPGSAALEERERWAVEVPVPGAGPQRVTLTPPLLNQTVLAVFLVSGARKAWVLREVLEGRDDSDRFPARLIRPTGGEVVWYVDESAGRLVRRPERG